MATQNAWFGPYGGQFVPEILIPALDQLEESFLEAGSVENLDTSAIGKLKMPPFSRS